MQQTLQKRFWFVGLCCALQGTAWAQALTETQVKVETEVEEIFEPASVNLPTTTDGARSWIEMYGVRLSTATRDTMRQALHTHGVKPVREDARYWVDVYDAKKLLRGASQFYLGYTAATHKLAFAEYAFVSFMNSSHTQRIMDMVTAKYGPPTETVGQLSMGAFTARWRMAEGMHIQVVREWPETSTYLKFINPVVDLEMKAELDREISTRLNTKMTESTATRSPAAGPSAGR